ncbi:unnamed protein product [marine sediment metagenome]|uniref:Uncharacterized protein n=1 Tax=marine sediment metagenome TaxID=412755 RepID=X0RV85_9ZZZZ
MELSRRIILVLVMAVVATVIVLPCSAEEKKDEKDIWTEGERRGPGPGPGRGRGRGRFELTEEEIDQIMKGLQESNPEKAKELAKLREADPNQFSVELRRHGHEEFVKIIRERIEKGRSRWRAEFLEWLGKAVRKEAEELAKLKEISPDLYAKKFELIRRKYWRIFEESKRNPELAKVLLDDLELKKRRDELLKNIKAAKSEKEKKKLVAELEEVVAGRFDLIVRIKQIAYERLLKRLEELQKRLKESRGEIFKSRDEKFKNENVKQRMQDLLEEIPKFNWD